MILTELLQLIDEPLPRFDLLDQYYRAQQPLTFLAPEAKTALGNRFGRMASNIPRLAVTSLAERLRVSGFSRPDVWPLWEGSNLDQLAGTVHREALTLGRSYVIVWAGADGRPLATIESARQVAVVKDPATRKVTAAVKRWESRQGTHAVVYLPDKVQVYRHPEVGSQITGFTLVETIPNHLGVVPVVEFLNGDRISDTGVSELEDLIPLVDALNKTLTDMLVTSEYVGRPRRWATGLEIEEDQDGNPVDPISETARTMLSEDPETKFGQLPAADLTGYESSVNVLLGQIMAVSALPAHYVGITSANPASADALRASEASLTARAEARQAQFGPAWEQVARLLVGVRDHVEPHSVQVSVKWSDASTRSVAQEADAVVKLVQAGILPVDYALVRLGYTEDEVAQIREARRMALFDEAIAS